MVKKISDFLKGEIISSIFYILFGLCLVLMPAQTIYIICKVVFGLVMVGAGIYHIYNYAREKENTTILDLFTGVIVFVLGGFLFVTPQIIIKLLPYLLGALVLVDSIWTLRGAWKLKKLGNTHWKVLVIGSLVFVGLGIFIIVYPFSKVMSTAIFAGCVMLADGISDIVFLVLLRKGIKKGVISKDAVLTDAAVPNSEATTNAAAAVAEPVAAEKTPIVQTSPEVDEGESEDAVQNEVIINGRWKQVAEDTEEAKVSPASEIGAMKPEEPKADASVTEEPLKEEPAAEETVMEEPPKTETQEEILEEWKD